MTTQTPIDIDLLQREVYATACAHGWHDKVLRTESPAGVIVYTVRVLAKLVLIHSEITEACDELANGKHCAVYFKPEKPDKPEGYAVEIADVCIRVLSICAALSLDIAEAVSAYGSGELPPEVAELNARPTTIALLHTYTSRATEYARVGDYDAFRWALAGLWRACFKACAYYQQDLGAAIRLKADYNKTRSHRHGGKLA